MQTQPMLEQRNDLTEAESVTPDWALLGSILRRRALLWIFLGPLLAAALLLLLLWRVPPMFSSTASLSMQQESGGAVSGALSALSGLSSSGSKSYLGVIRSHRFAASAAKQADIQHLYDLKTPEEATELIQKSVALDDRSDGLLYLTVTLPGPSPLISGAAARTKQVQVAAKQVNDAYLQSLNHYLQTSNSNRGSALLHQARGQLNGARIAYNISVRRLTDLAGGNVAPSISSSVSSAMASAVINSDSSGDSIKPKSVGGPPDTLGGGLQQLYLSRGQLAAEIQEGQAAQNGTSHLAASHLSELTALPAEDPLLAEARSQVRRASTSLQDLRIDLADDNPEVVAARRRLAEAQIRLRLQSATLQRGQTSETVQLDALRSKYKAVIQQIAVAERNFKTGRRFGAEIEERRNDVLLHLEVYKTAATQFAILSMQTVAGGNLMDVIDEGRIPASGKPGSMILAIISFCAVLFLLNLWLAVEYLVQVRQKWRQLAEQS